MRIFREANRNVVPLRRQTGLRLARECLRLTYCLLRESSKGAQKAVEVPAVRSSCGNFCLHLTSGVTVK
jgi:hypothetical protein